MNTEEIETKLAAWQADVSKLHSNIAELQNLIGYQLAHDGRELTGVTREKHLLAKAAEERLWTRVDLFSKLVAKIKTSYEELPTFGRGKAIEEITQLFDGDSIELPPEKVELESRDLFSDSKKVHKMSVATLRRLMSEDFQIIKDAYVKAGEAWEKVGAAISEQKKEVDRICAEERKFGKHDSADVVALSARLESTTRRWRNDPLGVTEDIKNDLAPYMQRANSFVASLAQARARIATDIQQAAAKLESLKALKVKALELHQGCVVELDPKHQAKAPPSTRGLSDWLVKLNGYLAAESWDDAQYYFKEWQTLYERLHEDTDAAVKFNQSLLDKRTDLRHRFFEALAKYKGYEQRGMEIPKSVHTFTEKGQELVKGKVDLDEAERIIVSLEVKVAAICQEFDRKQGAAAK